MIRIYISELRDRWELEKLRGSGSAARGEHTCRDVGRRCLLSSKDEVVHPLCKGWFVIVVLHEPPTQAVLGYRDGEPVEPEAFICAMEHAGLAVECGCAERPHLLRLVLPHDEYQGHLIRRIMVNWERHDYGHFKATGSLKNCRESWTGGFMGSLFD
jgi:hypothetical protein